MRLASQLKPWMMTALVVVVLLLSGGAYLVRLALRDEPTATFVPGPSPSEAPATAPPTGPTGTPAETGPARDPVATGPSTRVSTDGPSSTRTPATSASTVRTTRAAPGTTGPAPTSRGPDPGPTGTPSVVIAGPTVDNIYPNDDGCHIFYFAAAGVEATITSVRLSADEMEAEYVACEGTAEGIPRAAAGCAADRIVSSDRGCGIRMKVPASSPPGLYRGTLNFGLAVLCTDRKNAPCADISSPHPPSPDRPVQAKWEVTCPMELSLQAGQPQNAEGTCRLPG
jgi:hypothetical protein